MSGETPHRATRALTGAGRAGRPGTGRCSWDDGRVARSPSHLSHPAQDANPPVPTLLEASVPPACSLGVSLKSRPPCQDPPPAAPPPPPYPAASQPHLGAGAGPAHRPEQQQRQAERPGGAGHGGALRTGPSLPPAEPRARRLIPGGQRAAGAGEEPARAAPPAGGARRGPRPPSPARGSRPASCQLRCAAQPVPAREVPSPVPPIPAP